MWGNIFPERNGSNEQKGDSKPHIPDIRDILDIFPQPLREKLLNKISEAIDYEPVIGVMGKTGAGKSSVCNALFKGEVCAVSDVEACTREVQELRIRFGKHSLKIIDIPVSVRMPGGIRSMKIYTAICFLPGSYPVGNKRRRSGLFCG